MHEQAEPEQPARAQEAAASTQQQPPPPNTNFAKLEQRLCALEAQQTMFHQQQQKFWSYQQKRDVALQQTLQRSSKQFFSFPVFPMEILQTQFGEASERTEPQHEEEEESSEEVRIVKEKGKSKLGSRNGLRRSSRLQ